MVGTRFHFVTLDKTLTENLSPKDNKMTHVKKQYLQDEQRNGADDEPASQFLMPMIFFKISIGFL